MRSIKKIVKLLKFMKIHIPAQGSMPEKASPVAVWEKEAGVRVPVWEMAPEDIVYVLRVLIKHLTSPVFPAMNRSIQHAT